MRIESHEMDECWESTVSKNVTAPFDGRKIQI
jgi:hypothetical protein